MYLSCWTTKMAKENTYWDSSDNIFIISNSSLQESLILAPIITLMIFFVIWKCNYYVCRSQWPRGLRRKSLAARLLRLWVRIPPGAWIFVCCECCMLSGRGLCDGLIIRSEESYRMWRVVVCDQETSQARRLKPATGLWKYNPPTGVVAPGEKKLLCVEFPPENHTIRQLSEKNKLKDIPRLIRFSSSNKEHAWINLGVIVSLWTFQGKVLLIILPRNSRLEIFDIILLLYSIFISLREQF